MPNRSTLWPLEHRNTKTQHVLFCFVLFVSCRLWPTWGHSRRDGGGGDGAAALRGHGRHLDGVGGEGGQPRDLELQGAVGQAAGQPGLVPAIHLPGDLVPCKTDHPHLNSFSNNPQKLLCVQRWNTGWNSELEFCWVVVSTLHPKDFRTWGSKGHRHNWVLWKVVFWWNYHRNMECKS